MRLPKLAIESRQNLILACWERRRKHESKKRGPQNMKKLYTQLLIVFILIVQSASARVWIEPAELPLVSWQKNLVAGKSGKETGQQGIVSVRVKSGYLYGVDANTGKELYKVNLEPLDQYCSTENTIYIAKIIPKSKREESGAKLVARDVASDKFRSILPLDVKGKFLSATPPIFYKDQLYFVTVDGNNYYICVLKDKIDHGEVAWEMTLNNRPKITLIQSGIHSGKLLAGTSDGKLYLIDKGNIVGEADVGSAISFPPKIEGNRAYVIVGFQTLFAVSLQNMEILWHSRLPDMVKTDFVVANSIFYFVVASQRGDVVVALSLSNLFTGDAEKNFKELWRRTLDNQKIKYAPVIYRDSLIVAAKDVYAFNLADGKDSWEHGSYNNTINSLMEQTFARIQADGYSILTQKEKKEIRKDFPQITEKVAGSPTIIGDFIYVPTVSGSVYAFSLNRKSLFASEQNAKAPPFLFWVYKPTANIIATPVKVDGKICVGSTSGIIYVIDSEDGTFSEFSMGRGQISALTADGESIYVATKDGKLDKLKMLKHAGTVILEKDWQTPLGLYETISATPAILKDTVYLAAENKFIAVDGKTKEKRWSVETAGRIHTPLQISNMMAYTSTDNSIYGIDLSKSPLPPFGKGGKGGIWNIPTTAKILSGPSKLKDGMLWIGTEDGQVLAIGQNGNEIWRQKISDASIETTPAVGENGLVYVACANGEIVAVEGKNNVELWRTKTFSPNLLTPIVLSRHVLAISQNGNIYALLKNSGKQDWHLSIGGTIKSAPGVVDDVIYIVSHEGTIYALNPTLMFEW